jgi:hypothetical protein
MIRIPALRQTIGFADGKKYFSLLQVRMILLCALEGTLISHSQQMLPYVADIVPSRYHPLLISTRRLAEVAIYAQMKMPTLSRLKQGKNALLRFGESIAAIHS